MFYRFMQGLMRLALRVYFRKIYFAGAECIPPNKPVILACNHPNSFLDAVLLAVLVKEPIHFLARSDVFNTPFKHWLLQQFNLIPIYRLQEGAENLHRNEETFALCYQLLQKKGRILIFSEGLCIQEKRLRPLKKGTARLAFGAETANNWALDLQVIPVGINYTYPAQFRREALLSVSQPIPVKNLEALYRSQPARAVLELNQKISSALEEQVIIIPEKEQEEPIEALLVIERLKSAEFYAGPWLTHSRSWLQQEKYIIKKFISQTESNPGGTTEIKYPTSGKKEKINWASLILKWPRREIALLVLGLPFFMLGYILNILPMALARWVTGRQVKYIEFYSSVLLVTGLVFYLFYLLLAGSLGFLFSFTTGLSLLFLLPLTGYIALKYREVWRYRCHREKVFSFSASNN